MAEQPSVTAPNEPGFDTYVLTAEYTDRLLKTTFWRLAAPRLCFIVIFVAVLCGVLLIANRSVGAAIGCAVAYAIVLGVWLPIKLRSQFRKGNKLILAMPDRHYTVSFGREGVLQVSSIVRLQLKWGMLDKVRRYDDLWLFVVHSSRVIAVPTAAMPPGLADFIVEKAQRTA